MNRTAAETAAHIAATAKFRKARPYFVKSAEGIGASVELITNVWTQRFETEAAKNRQLCRMLNKGRLILDHGRNY